MKNNNNTQAFDARRSIATVTLLTFAIQNIALAGGPQVPAAGSGTTAYVAPNGVPVVNIAAPNASGLSHNRYDSFDVPKNGTVLNNATDVSQSILAGTIRENPNLNGKSASIILNDVTSTQRSVLEGYLEVHGPEAEVIVANPNGITCSGCGFINTPRASLTTGSPNLNANGNLLGFTVRQGEILINGKGLDASDPNYFDLLARTINIQGQINAKDLQVTAGANQFDYASRSVTGPAAASGDQPLYAIDSSALGGMYADRVRLLATDKGVGVRLLGEAAATAGDLTLTASGKIELKNKTYAANDINVSGVGIESGGDAKNYVYAEHDVKLDAGSGQLTQGDGLSYAGNKLDLNAKSIGMNSKGATMYAGAELNAKASQDINIGSGTVFAEGNVNLSAPSITVGGEKSVVYAKSNLNLTAGNDLNLGNGQIVADHDLQLTGKTIKDSSGTKDIRSAGNDLTMTTPGDIVLDNGQVYDGGHNLSLNGKRIQIGGTATTTLTGGYQAGGGISLNAGDLISIIGNGSIQSSGDVLLSSPEAIYLLQDSKILAMNNFTAESYKSFDIYGNLLTGGDINLRPNSSAGRSVTTVRNTGSVQSYGMFSLQGSGTDPKNNVELNIEAGDASKGEGQLLADSFDINADKIGIGSQDAGRYGLLQGGFHGGNIATNHLQLDGQYAKLIANTNIGDDATTSLNIEGDLSNPGLIFAFGNLNLNVSGNIDNLTDAAISSGFGNLNINMLGAGKRFDNQANATLYAFENLAVLYPNGGTFFNHATGANVGEYGIVQSSGRTRLGSNCDPTGTGSGLACNAGTPAVNITNQGRIESDGDISIVAQTFRNDVAYSSSLSEPQRKPGSGDGLMGDSQTFPGVRNLLPDRLLPSFGPIANYIVDGFVYVDFQRSFEQLEQITLAPYRPRISAGSQGGTLSISTQDGSNIGGTLEGFNVEINDFDPNNKTGVFHNDSITHDKINLKQQIGRYKWQCLFDGSGLANLTCDKRFSHVGPTQEEFPNGSSAFTTISRIEDVGNDLGATISAVNFHGNIATLSNKAATNNTLPQNPAIDPVHSITGSSTPLGTPKDPSVPTLPSGPNGQFLLNTSPKAKFLVESNPLYASSQNPFLGSDYLAESLGLDPDKLLLRLGDANYENRLIKDQIQQQAGLSLLRSAGDEYDQQKMLMDNASLEAKEQKLSFGVALSPDQVAALKHDMVWMVEKEVQGHKVLVPVVYLTDATRSQSGKDAVILAQNAVITGEEFQNRGGTVSGSEKLVVVTRKDIENTSGTLKGGKVALKSLEGDIINRTQVTRLGNGDNYYDAAGKTGSISATESLAMDAAHDVKIEGANTYSAGKTNIHAGNDVSISSLALESSYHGTSAEHRGGSTTTYDTLTKNQHAQNASVGSDGNLTISADKNVNVKGATVNSQDGDTTLLAKEGNVNITTLELKNSESRKTHTEGFFSEAQVDDKNRTVDGFQGYQNTSEKSDFSYTQNAGSYVGGKGVNLVAQKGDVNVKGSDVNAGENGAYIDAANDVNITAAYDTYSSSTSYQGYKVGISGDANADGGAVGIRFQRQSGDATLTGDNARTSSINSGGNIVVKAGNKLTNEGTDYDAKNDIYVSAKEVENKAAYSSSSYSRHDESDQYGISGGGTTNGMGQSIADLADHKPGMLVVAAPEAQLKIGGESTRSSLSGGEREGKITKFKSDGSQKFSVEKGMVDEGASYDAGESIKIDAGSYVNNAVTNTKYEHNESTVGGGQLTVGISTASEVTGTASSYGSHSQDGGSSSRQVAGGFKAGKDVTITTKGDTILEGTNIKAGEKVAIDAGGDLIQKQLRNTDSKSTASQQASANVSASVCVDLACVSGGAGADGRTANGSENNSKGVAGSIEGKNISLHSGGDMTLEGTNLKSGGDTELSAGGNFDYKALESTSSRNGQADGGGAQLGGGGGTSGKALENGSLNVSGSFERGRDSYEGTDRKGSTVDVGGKFTLKSGGNAHMEGTQVTASTADVDVKGDFKMESAQSTEKQDSYSTKGTANVGGSKGGGAMGAAGAGNAGGSGNGGAGGNNLGGGADVDVDVHKKDNLTNQNAHIKTTGGTTLNVGGDVTLAGARIDAGDGVSGEIKGDVKIETRTDRINQEDTTVKTFAGINSVTTGESTQGQNTADKINHAQGKILEGAGNVAGSGVDIDVDSHKKDDVTIGERSGISGGAGGLAKLKVDGNVTMKGASEEILGADINGSVSKSEVETHKNDSDVSFRAPGSLSGALGKEPGKLAEVGGTLFDMPGGGGHDGGEHDFDRPATRPRSNADAPEPLNLPRHNGGSEHDGLALNRPDLPDHQPPLEHNQPQQPQINRPRGGSEPALPSLRQTDGEQPALVINRPRSGSEPVLPNQRQPEGEHPQQPAHQPADGPNLADHVPDNSGGTYMNQHPQQPVHQPADGPNLADHVPDNSGSTYMNQHPQQPAHQPADGQNLADHVPDNSRGTYMNQHPQQPAHQPADGPNLADHVPDNSGGTYMNQHPQQPVHQPADGPNLANHVPDNSGGTYMNQHPQQPVHQPADGPNLADHVPDNSGGPYMNQHPQQPAHQPADGQNLANHVPDNSGSTYMNQRPVQPPAANQNTVDTQPSQSAKSDVPRNDGKSELPDSLRKPLDPGKQQVFFSDDNKFKMRTLLDKFKGEDANKSPFWIENGRDVKVTYLDRKGREEREILIKDGVLYKSDGKTRFDTTEVDKGAIFVMDGKGRIYASTENFEGVFHHSSFLAGQPVAMAGHMIVSDGKLVHLDNQSGHYRPDLEQLKIMRNYLEHQGVDLDQVRKVGLVEPEPGQIFGPWVDFGSKQRLEKGADPRKESMEQLRVESGSMGLPGHGNDQHQLEQSQGTSGTTHMDEPRLPALPGMDVSGKNPHTQHDPEKLVPVYSNNIDTPIKKPMSPASNDASFASPQDSGRLNPSQKHESGKLTAVYVDNNDAPIKKSNEHFGIEDKQPEHGNLLKDKIPEAFAPAANDSTHKPNSFDENRSGETSKGEESPYGGELDLSPSTESNDAPEQETFVNDKGFIMKPLNNKYKGENNQDKVKFEEGGQGVKYLTEEERDAREVVVKDGLLVYKKTGAALDTGNKNDGAIFVMDGEGRIYASTENKIGEFHHSSFLAGEPVAMSGHMVVSNGKLAYIDNSSGHYQPLPEQLKLMRKVLADKDVDLSQVPNIGLHVKDGKRLWTNFDTGKDLDLKDGDNPQKQAVERLQNNRSSSFKQEHVNPNHELSMEPPQTQKPNSQAPSTALRNQETAPSELKPRHDAIAPSKAKVLDQEQGQSPSQTHTPNGTSGQNDFSQPSGTEAHPLTNEDLQKSDKPKAADDLLPQTKEVRNIPGNAYDDQKGGPGVVQHEELSEDLKQPVSESDDEDKPAESKALELPTFESKAGFKMKPLGGIYRGEQVGDDSATFWKGKNIKVEYLTPAERDQMEVVIKDGLLYKKDGRRLDTMDNADGAIFVMDGDGRIYASTKQKPGTFHHSSFLAGEAVAMAGHMIVKDGKLMHIDNYSGHYKPYPEQLQEMRTYLEDRKHVDLSEVPNIGLHDPVGGKLFGIWTNFKTGKDFPKEAEPRTQAFQRAIKQNPPAVQKNHPDGKMEKDDSKQDLSMESTPQHNDATHVGDKPAKNTAIGYTDAQAEQGNLSTHHPEATQFDDKPATNTANGYTDAQAEQGNLSTHHPEAAHVGDKPAKNTAIGYTDAQAEQGNLSTHHPEATQYDDKPAKNTAIGYTDAQTVQSPQGQRDDDAAFIRERGRINRQQAFRSKLTDGTKREFSRPRQRRQKSSEQQVNQ